jgi:hypothetical protein
MKSTKNQPKRQIKEDREDKEKKRERVKQYIKRATVQKLKTKAKNQGSSTWIASLHAILYMDSYSMILQSFMSLFTDSSYVKFGLPSPLFT